MNGVNYSGAGTTWGLENTIRFRAAAPNNTAKTVLVGDSAEFFINAPWVASPTYPDGYSTGAPKRHGNTANYLYVDGHVGNAEPGSRRL